MQQAPLVVGICGGSGSGKSSITNLVIRQVGHDNVSMIAHDNYYCKLNHLPFAERAATNFDHPDSLETDRLIQDLKELKSGKSVEIPVYDFSTHCRREDQTLTIQPRPVILLEGILIFADVRLRELIDIKIFVDTDPDIRFIRRLKRDIAERGRTVEDVTHQYLTTVRPMYLEFVDPTKRYADMIIPEGGYHSSVAISMLVSRLKYEL